MLDLKFKGQTSPGYCTSDLDIVPKVVGCIPEVHIVDKASSFGVLPQINSDGAWRHEEGIGGFGAVFRDYKGHFVGAFASNIDIPSSVAAEVMAVITAIELAWVRDWKHVWLEINSSTVLDYIRTPSLVPWQLRVRWLNCLYRISTMTFKSSHIFREGNRVADALANHGTSLSEQIWWDVPPLFILSYYERDFLGMPNFRLR
ncbi:hypothetical protein ACLB2K_056885 [Fragaria x ananassa]